MKAKGQSQKPWFFPSLLHKNKTTSETQSDLRTIFEVVIDFWEENNNFSILEAKNGLETASILQFVMLMGARFFYLLHEKNQNFENMHSTSTGFRSIASKGSKLGLWQKN